MDTLGEDLVLLSLGPDSGRVRTAQKIGYGLMGSELVRLAASGRVDVQAGRIIVLGGAPTGHAELDAALASIVASRRPPHAGRWVGHPRRDICASYLERLAAAGRIRREGRLLARWRIVDVQRVAEARARLEAIAVPGAELDQAQAALGGLAHAIGLDAVLYPGWPRDVRKRFQQIAKGQWVATAVSRAAAAGANKAAMDAATQAAVSAATQAAMNAATQAAVQAATQAAVDASVAAAHSAGAGAHGAHGGH